MNSWDESFEVYYYSIIICLFRIDSVEQRTEYQLCETNWYILEQLLDFCSDQDITHSFFCIWSVILTELQMATKTCTDILCYHYYKLNQIILKQIYILTQLKTTSLNFG